MAFFVSAGLFVVLVPADVPFLTVFAFTTTLHTYFFLPTFACTFADPAFFAATTTLAFFFFCNLILSLPDLIDHFAFFFAFLIFNVFFFPTVSDNFFTLNFTFFAAAAGSAGESRLTAIAAVNAVTNN